MQFKQLLRNLPFVFVQSYESDGERKSLDVIDSINNRQIFLSLFCWGFPGARSRTRAEQLFRLFIDKCLGVQISKKNIKKNVSVVQ